MLSVRLLCLVIPAITLAACRTGAVATAPGSDPNGVYAYRATSGNDAVVEGTMSIELHADSSVTGSWTLQRVAGSDPGIVVGPQIGTGTLAGRVVAGRIVVDLNPGWADNNVFLALSGTARDLLMGTWDHATIIGSVAGGPVELRRLTR
jgi:hypothetical protein